jgi:tetratricopeptide (TPR) repeat protein
MARRRINTTFLGYVCAALVVIAVGLILVKKFLIHENPKPFIAQGDMYAKNGDWEHAAINYIHASQLLPKDVPLALKSGAALMHLVDQDPSNIGAAASEWRRAVEIDPDCKEAWQSLMDIYQADLSQLETQPRNDRTHDLLTQYYTLNRETATQLIRLAPKDLRIQSIVPALNIRLWLMDIPLPLTAAETTQPYDNRPSDDQKVNSAIVELSELLRQDPGNSQAAWWIARAKIHQAQLLLQKDQNDDAYTLIDEATKMFDDPILQNPPDVIDLYINKVQILSILQQADHRPEMREIYAKRLHEGLEKAQAIADPKETQKYIMLKAAWAHEVSLTDPGRAEALFKDVIAKNPTDIGAKMDLATMLKNDVTRRGDALAVLDQVPASPPLGMSMIRREEMKSRIQQVQLLRAEILTNQMGSSQDPKEKDQLAAQVQHIIDDLSTSTLEKWRLEKMQGRFQLVRGQYRDAIQTLSAANDALSAQSEQKDSELLLLLAQAERHGEQTGNAIAMLAEAMKDPRVFNNPTPHMELAELYLLDRNVEKARPHVEWLAVRFPDNPDIIRLEIHALNPVTDHDAIIKLYQKLPETNRAERVNKLSMARELNSTDEVLRLLKVLHATAPDDVAVTYQYGVSLLIAKQNDQAKQVSEEALKLKPDDPTLRLLAEAVNGGTGKDISDAVHQQIGSISDPFVRETKFADFARLQGRSDEELTHLKAASKIQPENAAVLERIFLWYLAAGQFDNADEYVGRLAAVDADQAHGQLYKFKVAMAKGDIQSALAIGRQLTEQYKEFSLSWESLGQALEASGQFDAAAAKYQEALNKQPTNVKALQGLISCSYRLGKLEDAKRYIQDARQKFPNDPNYKKLEIEHELRYGDPETVLASVRDDVEHSSDNPQSYSTAASALMRAGAVKYAKGDPDTAKAHIAEARQLLEKAVAKWPDSIGLVTQLATACAQSGDVPAGEAAMKSLQTLPRWKGSPAPAVALAEFYMQTNQPASAEAPLRDVLAKTNNLPDIELKLAQVLFEQQKFEAALGVLEQHQDLLAVRKMRTETLLSLNRGPQAEGEILQALKTTPNDRELTKLLLFIYYGQGKNEEVKKLATQCIAADANNLPAYYYRALSNTQGRKPDLDSAINDLSYVRDQTADNIDARMALSRVRMEKGDLVGATSEMEATLRAFPQNKSARLRLLELYEQADPPHWIDAEQVVTDGLGLPQLKNDADMLRAAAIMWARRGDTEKALTDIRAAMAALPDKTPLIHDYLNVLLMGKHYDSLLTETEPLIANTNTAVWWVYDFRGQARAGSGDMTGATKEFNSALTLAGTEKTHTLASYVAHDVVVAMGLDSTVALIAPRTQNSAMWKLVVIPLMQRQGDRAGAIKMAEAAMAASDSLSPSEQDELLGMSAALYLSIDPPATDKAVAMYQQLLHRHSDDYISMNNLACIYEGTDPPQTQEALKYANQAFETVKASGRVLPLIYDTEGWALILSGQVDDGINVLHQAIDQSDFPDAHYHLAEGYLRKQLPEDAQRELAQANDLIVKATAAKQHVDTTLTAKIDAAQKRAKKMLDDKTQAAAP